MKLPGTRSTPGAPAGSSSTGRGRLELLAAALLFSTGGAAIKVCDLGGWAISGGRSGLAVVVLCLALPSARRRWTGPVWLVGAAYAGCVTSYAIANRLTTAAHTIFLQSTAPLYILLFAPWLLGEKWRPRDLPFMGAMAVGMGLFFVGRPEPTAVAADPALGNALGALAGICWAGTVMGLRWLGRSEERQAGSAAAAAACGNLLAFLIAVPMALPMAPPAARDLVVVAYLGLVQVGLAYVFMSRGIRSTSALEASLLLLLEPVLTPVWAYLVHGEDPGSWAILGGALIVVASLWRTLRNAPAAPRGAA